MADAWGGSWGSSWGVSWGSDDEVAYRPDPGGGEASRRKARRLRSKQELEELLASREETPPPPTPRRVRAVQREIVEEVAGGLLGPEREQLAKFVKREIVKAYKPSLDWAELARAFETIARKAAEEAEEIEDEEFLLMFA